MNYQEFKVLLMDLETRMLEQGIEPTACDIGFTVRNTGEVRVTLTRKIVNTVSMDIQLHA